MNEELNVRIMPIEKQIKSQTNIPKFLTMSEIENVSKELITKDWEAIQNGLWRMIEQHLKYQFTIKACKWLRLHMPFGEVDKELRDNIIDEFESFMKK